jgi:signal transduction histidine kinase
MKITLNLNTKVIITYIFISTVLFAIAGIVLFNYLKREVDEKVDWKLYADKQRIIEATRDSTVRHEKRTMYHTINRIADRYVDIEKVKGNLIPGDELKDTLLPTFLYGGNVRRPYRQLRFYTSVDDQVYKITLRKLLVERVDLREGIVNSLLYVFIALLIILIFANYIISRRIWSPFYKTVEEIDRYDFTGVTPIVLKETDIREFNVLNKAITRMSEKIRKDFLNLKEFAENASHEIQTPLAVINSKLELLIQSEKLDLEQSDVLQDMHAAVLKLSKLNQSLILITKIENAQFVKKEEIYLEEEVENSLKNFEDLIHGKNLQVKLNMDPNVRVEMERTLAEILISNLVANAIKHNLPAGNIEIVITAKELVITNSGEPLTCDPEQLFKRFQKIHRSSESLGLGLSIVKSICDFYQLDISYINDDTIHTVVVKLKTTDSL